MVAREASTYEEPQNQAPQQKSLSASHRIRKEEWEGYVVCSVSASPSFWQSKLSFFVDTRQTTYLRYLFRYTMLTPAVYKIRLSEHVAELLIAGGRTCVSHQFLNRVLLFTATSSSLAGRESPNFQRAFIMPRTCQRLEYLQKACPEFELRIYKYLPTEQGLRKEVVHHGLLRNLHKTDPGHS